MLEAEAASPVAAAAHKVARVLRDLETYVSGQSELIIDYATARRRDEPISTATTESTVQWLLHRRMNAQQQMRWSPRGAHQMLKVRTAVMNGTLERDHAVAERRAPTISSCGVSTPRFRTVSDAGRDGLRHLSQPALDRRETGWPCLRRRFPSRWWSRTRVCPG